MIVEGNVHFDVNQTEGVCEQIYIYIYIYMYDRPPIGYPPPPTEWSALVEDLLSAPPLSLLWDGSWVLPQDLRLTHRAAALFVLDQKTV